MEPVPVDNNCTGESYPYGKKDDCGAGWVIMILAVLASMALVTYKLPQDEQKRTDV